MWSRGAEGNVGTDGREAVLHAESTGRSLLGQLLLFFFTRAGVSSPSFTVGRRDPFTLGSLFGSFVPGLGSSRERRNASIECASISPIRVFA